MLTIFTPTFNRGPYLKQCYQSLKTQSYRDFEWIIVDDGSTDNTREIIHSFIEDGEIEIRYLYQTNSGKQAAWNNAVQKAKGEYFIGVDSDDALVDDGLAIFFEKYISILKKHEDCVGIRALSQSSEHEELYSSGFLSTEEISVCSWFSEFASKIEQERIDLFKTKILLEFLYPVEDNTKFIPEVWLYVHLSEKYKFVYVNQPLRVFYDDHRQNRLSRSSIRKHARGHYLSRKAMITKIPLSYFKKNPMALVKSIIRLIQARIYILLEDYI